MGLLATLGLLAAFELATRYVVPLFIANIRVFAHEYGNSCALKGERGRRAVLVLGNSLTRTDVDVPLFSASLGDGVKVQRWAIDDTQYLDWLFGLRRAFRQGARPTS